MLKYLYGYQRNVLSLSTQHGFELLDRYFKFTNNIYISTCHVSRDPDTYILKRIRTVSSYR